MTWIEGRFEENVITTTLEARDELGTAIQHLANDIWTGVLCH
jgi:hypothetical protein